jgi:hypothetical protein
MTTSNQEHDEHLAGPDREAPSPWDLQRQIARVDHERRQDFQRLEDRHQADRVELRGQLDQLAMRLEGAIKANAGVSVTAWDLHKAAQEREFTQVREDIGGVRADLDKLRNLYVGTILVMILGGVGALVLQGGFAAL